MRLSDVDTTDLKNAINSGYLHVTFFIKDKDFFFLVGNWIELSLR